MIFMCVFLFFIGKHQCWTDDSFHYFDGNVEPILSTRSFRIRRSTVVFEDNSTFVCDTTILPQPTFEYPAVLFVGENFNNCSQDGTYMRVRADNFVKWGANTGGEVRTQTFTWVSMLMLDNVDVTFRACCPSGNDFYATVNDWKSTPSMNLSVFYHPTVAGAKGIYYRDWLHWVMSFMIKVHSPTAPLSSCGECHFGGCGATGNCECKDGYTGPTCLIRPSSDAYPTQSKPLVLFEKPHYAGTYTHASPDEFVRFAWNERGVRKMAFQSVRVLHNRTVTFARNIIFTSALSPGANLPDVAEFLAANAPVADPIWYNYDRSIALDFHVKVEGNPRCDNCSISNGVCYTGQCLCVNEASGIDCNE